MENIYSKNGLQAVINASGRMTKLGVFHHFTRRWRDFGRGGGKLYID